jgi:hypothetical protein
MGMLRLLAAKRVEKRGNEGAVNPTRSETPVSVKNSRAFTELFFSVFERVISA